MIDFENFIRYRNIEESDYEFLYDLLKQRNETINISHKSMPTFEEHCNFWNNCDYDIVKIFTNKNYVKFGYFYITKLGEIGIFISEKWQDIGIGKKVIEFIIKKFSHRRLLANINPSNVKSIKMFKDKGFKLIQNTYEYDKK